MTGVSPVDRGDNEAWQALLGLRDEAVAYRKRWGKSQRQLAESMGVAQSKLSALEAGQNTQMIRWIRYLRSMGLELAIRPIKAKRGS